MRFRTEEQLYRVLLKGYEREVTRLEEGLRRAGTLPSSKKLIEAQGALTTIALGALEDCEYFENQLHNPQQRVYIIGEAHSSIKPVQFTRRELVSKISEDAKSWLFFIEGAGQHWPYPFGEFLFASKFYFPELAKLLRVPYVGALADPLSPYVIQYMKEDGLTEEELDRIRTHKATDSQDLEPLPVQLANTATKSRNRYSRERFHRIRQKYPDGTKILAVIGKRHVEVFR